MRGFIFRLGIVVAAAAVLSGCGTVGRTARIDPAGVSVMAAQADVTCPLTSTIAGDTPFAIDLDCFKFDPEATNSIPAYRMATTGNEEDQRQARNRLEEVLITQANLICEDEQGRMYAYRAVSNSVLDFLSSGFSGASTIVGGDQAKSILSGLAGLSTATRTNIDSNIYQNQVVSALTKVMHAERRRILTEMQAKHSTPTSNYSADAMIRRANEYHQACSFQRGMELLLDAAVNKEGLDAIVKEMNLRQEQESLARTISAAQALSLTDSQMDQLRTRFLEVSLQRSQNAQTSPVLTSPNQDPDS